MPEASPTHRHRLRPRSVALLVGMTLGTTLGAARPAFQPVLKTTLPGSWDENWFASPAVHDLDGDGKAEIIASRASVLYVWNAQGALAWRAVAGSPGVQTEVHGTERQYSGPVVGDLDGVGKGEIAIAYANKAAVYDAQGRLLPGWPQTFPGLYSEIRSIAAADLNGDGRLEILVHKFGVGPTTMAFALDGSPVAGWPQTRDCAACNEYGGFNQNLGVSDLDGDGKPEVVATFDMTHIGIFHAIGKPFAAHASFAAAGPWASSVPMFHDLALAVKGYGPTGQDRDEFTYSPPVFADFDGDGRRELLLHSHHERAGDTTIRGNCLWALRPDMRRAPGFEKPLCSDEPLFTGYRDNIVETSPAPAVGDITGDGRAEIVVPSNDGTVRCYGADGAPQWKYRVDTAGDPVVMASEAVIGDLGGDGRAEIVFTTYSLTPGVSHLFLLDAAGRVLSKTLLDKRGGMAAPTLMDADGDGALDIVISLKDAVGGGKGGVQIWTVEGAGKAPGVWPTGRGSFLRTGVGAEAKVSVKMGKVKPAGRAEGRRKSAERRPWFDGRGAQVERGASDSRIHWRSPVQD